MDTRKPETVEDMLLVKKVPDLALHKMGRTFSFKLPKHHRKDSEAEELPDITPELSDSLKVLWELRSLVEERPVKVMVNAVREHLEVINPYLEALKKSKRSCYESWEFIYKIAHELERAADATKLNRFYSIPESLRLEEMQARMDISKADTEFAAANEAYTAEFDKGRQEIVRLEAKLKEIADAKDMATLAKYNKLHHAAKTSKKPGCLSPFYAFFRYSPAKSAVTINVATPQGAQKFQELRDKLLREYEDEINFKTSSLNDFGDRAPKKQDNYRDAWRAVKAKIFHDQADFYRCQNRNVMLHCVRLYALTVGTYYRIYNENPFSGIKHADEEQFKTGSKINDNHDKSVQKAKALFRQMIKGMKSHLGLFYCLQPDRCEFLTYMDNYNHIQKPEDRDAILAGIVTEEIMQQLFRDFESPEEAFQVSQPDQQKNAATNLNTLLRK